MNALAPLRWSNLKNMGRSPAHYRYFLDNPVVESDAMRVGSRVHDLVLDGGRNRFAIWEGGTRRGKEWDSFASAHSDATIIKAEQEDRAQAIAAAVKGNDEAMKAIFGCVTEQYRTWMIGDRPCCGTPDAVGPSAIVDLKVTRDASPGRFPFHAQRMGWLGQLAWYDNGVFAGNADSLKIIAVEDLPPHPVTVFQLTPEACEMGSRTWRSHFERLLVCEASGAWPEYSEAVVPLDVDSDLVLTIDGEEIEL